MARKQRNTDKNQIQKSYVKVINWVVRSSLIFFFELPIKSHFAVI